MNSFVMPVMDDDVCVFGNRSKIRWRAVCPACQWEIGKETKHQALQAWEDHLWSKHQAEQRAPLNYNRLR